MTQHTNGTLPQDTVGKTIAGITSVRGFYVTAEMRFLPAMQTIITFTDGSSCTLDGHHNPPVMSAFTPGVPARTDHGYMLELIELRLRDQRAANGGEQ